MTKALQSASSPNQLRYSSKTRWRSSHLISKMEGRRMKSLGYLSRKFVLLFLVADGPIVTLDHCSAVLIGRDVDRDSRQFKSKSN